MRRSHREAITQVWDVQDSVEPNPTNSDVAAHYSISGTAQNGIDYSNLTGEVTVSNNQGWAEIDIDPIADGLKPDQTVILTLLQNMACNFCGRA